MAERSITDWAGAATKNALREVLSDVIDRGMQGWLEKRSGGQKGRHSLHHFVHHIVEHWDRRYFVLPPKPKRGGLLWPESSEKAWVEAGGGARHDHVLKYYKSEDAYRDGEPPLAGIDLRGATVDLLHVKGSFLDYSAVTLHFILHTRERELKLKASCAVSYERWLTALAGAGVGMCRSLKPLPRTAAESAIPTPLRPTRPPRRRAARELGAACAPLFAHLSGAED